MLVISIIQWRYFAPILATKMLLSEAKTDSEYGVAWLIAKGANVNATDKNKMTPLMLAAESNSNPGVIQVLIDNAADINVIDKDGRTPLMIAAEKNPNPEVLQILRENVAGVAIEDESHKMLLAFIERNKGNKATMQEVYALLGWERPMPYYIVQYYSPGPVYIETWCELVMNRLIAGTVIIVLFLFPIGVASILRNAYIFLLKACARRKL